MKIVWFEVNDTGMELSFLNASMKRNSLRSLHGNGMGMGMGIKV